MKENNRFDAGYNFGREEALRGAKTALYMLPDLPGYREGYKQGHKDGMAEKARERG